MYALVACLKDGDEPTLIATARTLSAMQKKWTKAQAPSMPRYHFMGILTGSGLVNFWGKEIQPSTLGYVTLKMGLDYKHARAVGYSI